MYSKPDTRSRVRRIALVTLDRLDQDALCYAFNACQRMETHLDILTNLPAEEIDQMAVSIRGTFDTPWRVILIGSSTGDDIVRYARSETGLIFLASGIGDMATRRLRREYDMEKMRPNIPWVVVAGKKDRS